jgi:hypothetical protein
MPKHLHGRNKRIKEKIGYKECWRIDYGSSGQGPEFFVCHHKLRAHVAKHATKRDDHVQDRLIPGQFHVNKVMVSVLEQRLSTRTVRHEPDS